MARDRPGWPRALIVSPASDVRYVQGDGEVDVTDFRVRGVWRREHRVSLPGTVVHSGRGPGRIAQNRNATMQLYVSAMFEVTRTVWNEVRVLRGPARV